MGQTLLARFVFLGDRNEESKFIVVKFRYVLSAVVENEFLYY